MIVGLWGPRPAIKWRLGRAGLLGALVPLGAAPLCICKFDIFRGVSRATCLRRAGSANMHAKNTVAPRAQPRGVPSLRGSRLRLPFRPKYMQ